jgi:hypothetical protein
MRTLPKNPKSLKKTPNTPNTNFGRKRKMKLTQLTQILTHRTIPQKSSYPKLTLSYPILPKKTPQPEKHIIKSGKIGNIR